MGAASLAAAMTRSIGMPGSARAILSRIERLNRMFSCSTTPNWRRSHALSTLEYRRRPRARVRFLGRIGVDQLGERAFSSARWSDNANSLASWNVETDLVHTSGPSRR